MKTDRASSIKSALAEALSSVDGRSSEEVLEKVLTTLDKQKVFRYHNEDTVNLLSTAGRVLIAIIEDPTLTQRAISVYLDISETMIDKSIRVLISDGLITKTKKQRQNVYKINHDAIKKHPDFKHFYDAWKIVSSLEEKEVNKVDDDSIF